MLPDCVDKWVNTGIQHHCNDRSSPNVAAKILHPTKDDKSVRDK